MKQRNSIKENILKVTDKHTRQHRTFHKIQQNKNILENNTENKIQQNNKPENTTTKHKTTLQKTNKQNVQHSQKEKGRDNTSLM